MLLKYRLLHLLLGSVLLSSASQANELPIEISGFGKVVGGYLDDPDLTYQGYEDELSFDSQSLAAIQVDWQVMPKLSVTTQLLAHSNKNRESGVEWLYLTYEVDDQWQIRLGKQRTPFFSVLGCVKCWFCIPLGDAPPTVIQRRAISNL